MAQTSGGTPSGSLCIVNARIFDGESRELTEGSVRIADGVIVGSALVHTMLDESGKNAVDEATGLKALAAKAEELADGIHNARSAK